MTAEEPISFADLVRVVSTDVTDRAGIANQVGQVYGFTTPSVTGVEVLGGVAADFAYSVHFEDGSTVWMAPELLSFVDHAAGTEVGINGAPMKHVRRPDGGWDEVPLTTPAEPRQRWWRRWRRGV